MGMGALSRTQVTAFKPIQEGPAIRRLESGAVDTRPFCAPVATQVDCPATSVTKGMDTLGVKRKFAPTAQRKGRGSLRAAVLAASRAGRSDAVESLRSGFYSRTSTGPRAAMWLTARTILRKSFCEPLPLTVDKLVVLAAALKKAAYRAAKNYLFRAKQEHVRSGFAWSDALQDTLKMCLRSTARGIGQAKAAEVFMLEDIAKHRAEAAEPLEPVVPGGLIAPFDAVLVASSWMMRGLEAATVLAEQATVSEDESSATIELGPTKMNPEGRECPRSLVCSCMREGGKLVQANPCCPVHALVRLLAARAKHGLSGKHCLLSGREGGAVTARKTVATLRAVSKDLSVSEHSMRRAGAQFYARNGVVLFVIQFLGRWGSAVVERYVGNAYIDVAAKASLGTRPLPLLDSPSTTGGTPMPCVASGDSSSRAVDTWVEQANGKLKEFAKEWQENLRDEQLSTIGGVKGHGTDKKVHRVLIGDASLPVDCWRTFCGWKFGQSPHMRVGASTVNCKRCRE